MCYKIVNFCEIDNKASKSYSRIHNISEELNLGDISLINENDLSDFNLLVGGSPCFIAGTKVFTENGFKNIEDLKEKELVLTHNNRFMPIERTGHNQDNNIYELKAMGNLPIVATPNHPFLVVTRKRITKNINGKKTTSYVFSEPYKKRLDELVPYEDFLCSPVINTNNNPYNLDKETCWILGKYIADGHIRYKKRKNRKNSFIYQLILSIGTNKLSDFTQCVKQYKYSINPHSKSVTQVIFSSKKLVDFIINNNFGTKSDCKKIPNVILNLPTDLLLSFLDGYFSGDGCYIEKTKTFQATTVSKELAITLQLAIQKVYKCACKIYFQERPKTTTIEGRIVNQKDTYQIKFKKESKKQSFFVKDNMVFYPIKSIIDKNCKATVYNIEVQEDHTYCISNCFVGNCQDFSTSGKREGAIWKCNDCNHKYNPLTVNFTQRNLCPMCKSKNIDKTRSSLIIEYLRILNAKKPSFAIYENVKNLVSKEFKPTFDLFIKELEDYGYNVYYNIMNSKYYGIPQNRERVILVAIRKDLDNGLFKYPEKRTTIPVLKDFLDKNPKEELYLQKEKSNEFLKKLDDNVKNKLIQIYKNWLFETNEENIPVLPLCCASRGRNKDNPSSRVSGLPTEQRLEINYNNTTNTLTSVLKDNYILEPKTLSEEEKNSLKDIFTNGNIKFNEDWFRLRKLSCCEYFKLMGFAEEDYYNAKYYKDNEICNSKNKTELDNNNNKRVICLNNGDAYKQAGNSIVSNVLFEVYKELFIAMPYLFDDLKIMSLFSGIGAFEKGLNMFYDWKKDIIKQGQIMDNLYILLGLSIDPIEQDSNVINEALNKKVGEWQRDSKNPRKATVAKEYLQQLPTLKEILNNACEREKIAKEALQIRNDKLNDLKNDVLIRTIDKPLGDNDIEFLFSKYKDYGITKEYIAQNYSNLSTSDGSQSSFNIPDFSKDTASQLSTYIKSLNKNSLSLYEYLEISKSASLMEITNVIDSKLRIIIQKGTKTNTDEVEQKILGLARIIFSSSAKKKEYDSWLSFSYNLKLNDLIKDALSVNNSLTKNLFTTLLNIASNEHNVDTDEASRYIMYSTQYLGYNIDESVNNHLEEIRQKELELQKQRQAQRLEEERIKKQKELERQQEEERIKREQEEERIRIQKEKLQNIITTTADYINKNNESCHELNNKLQEHYKKRTTSGYQTYPDNLYLILYITLSFVLLGMSVYVNIVNNLTIQSIEYLFLLTIPANIINTARAIRLKYLTSNIDKCVAESSEFIEHMKKLIKSFNNENFASKGYNECAKLLNVYSDKAHIITKDFHTNYNNWVKYNNQLKYNKYGYFKPWITYVCGGSMAIFAIYFALTFL